MFTEIHMSSVASFKNTTVLKTDKKVNLIYGLNGTGKSTISNFFYSPDEPRYSACKKSPAASNPVLVYNQTFVQDNFFVSDKLKGIFSLSKENKEAEEKIAKFSKLSVAIQTEISAKQEEKSKLLKDFEVQKSKSVGEVWKIKTQYSGGDRVLEYCLKGLMSDREKLFNTLLQHEKPADEPTRNIQTLRTEVESLQGDSTESQLPIPKIGFDVSAIESANIFTTTILGNSDSEVAQLIEHLGNADWVQQGLKYLPKVGEIDTAICPFCQSDTINLKFSEEIARYFGGNYQAQVAQLEKFESDYVFAHESLPNIETLLSHPFAETAKDRINAKFKLINEIVRSNRALIAQKIRSPKEIVQLTSTAKELKDLNHEIDSINIKIELHNEKIKNKAASLDEIKAEFWSLMRWSYDQTISRYKSDFEAMQQSQKALDDSVKKLQNESLYAQNEIADAQKKTINVDDAVNAINASLSDLGILEFSIIRHSDALYRVARQGDPSHAFQTLSEGEKMMISFLYFCEMCKGKLSASDLSPHRVIVIDDPISSLSHIFVFNIGRLIKNLFFKSPRFSQVFILTHSLYFFYELTETNHEKRKLDQHLFRLTKGQDGSLFQEMKYEEIQNDYQAYWGVINNKSHPPALIANCMRNVIEYFFNFVRKKDLGNVFQMPELQEVRLQAFNRYINRESHSLGQNLIDMKEFDYDSFKDGLKLLFQKTGYADHYNAMAKL
ncbi:MULTISPECIES: AAA family ATPase [unclassified Variovorax]|uniref:AAA family ATPase n=1 Tax=unclassified Variovorax TaxID=663243 RepID=UPI0008AF2D42|nr:MULTISPECIES: AAA family ATPase [unclassified Variovorax]SEK16729.1 Wobble nucleotide-excising tRNase [Variovorax sp. OK202]SFE56635.1 Wobble nucleotide-excising tRNase [Variovorax sp. OK212]